MHFRPSISGAALAAILCLASSSLAEGPTRLSIASFQVDATPPPGSPLCDGAVKPVRRIDDRLGARGVVMRGAGAPIVLCAVDWVGIGNGGSDAWRKALADAAGTTPDRVAVHALHQHDAPGCDFEAEAILTEHGLRGVMFDPDFARRTIARAADALRAAMDDAATVTHVGLGRAPVEQVASTRRILGEDGRVKHVRYSAHNSDEVRAAPVGVIDPDVRLLSFWDGERPLAALAYYATHPMSHYGDGAVSCDFPGIARAMREAALPGVVQVYFTGAGGDVTAGKYNDGRPATRLVLAGRLAAGMKAAWESTRKVPLTPSDVGWRTIEVALPLNPRLHGEAELLREIDDPSLPMVRRIEAASDLAWVCRSKAGKKILLGGLRLGPAYVLHMPGELFVEYQLAAQRLRPSGFVCVAAYGDYGPGYIGTRIAYEQGGYEPTGSRVAPDVEGVLMGGMGELLSHLDR